MKRPDRLTPPTNSRLRPKLGRTPLWAVALGVLSAGFMLYLLRIVLIPFFLAAALEYLIGPLVDRLQKRVHGRRLPIVLLLYLAVIAPAVLLLYFRAPLILDGLRSTLETLSAALSRPADRLFGGAEIRLLGHTYTATDLQHVLLARLQQHLGSAEGVLRLTGFLVRLVLGAVLTSVLLFYFLLAERPLSRFLLYLTPPDRRPSMSLRIEEIDQVIGRYVRGMTIVVAYASASAWLGLGLVFHIPYALGLALLTGFLELLPAIGPVLSWMLAALAALVSGGFLKALTVAAFYGALRLSLDNFLGPIVLGRATAIHPVLIIFAFLAGGALFGVLGLLIAVPVAATVKLILDNRNSDRLGE